ncbi:unnamed protein product [Cuscuta campestris]|uniref:Germin-like protein n=1 Tax=Cuscuta campestris TaxID=132261 RepID=A0A484N158_9ASTE|nr:unnamed protein product [Cuscuta campestris]
MAAFHTSIVAILLLALIVTLANAYDPSPLQDFCVFDNTSTVLVNGLACKARDKVTAEDFFTSGLNTSTAEAAFPNSTFSAASVTTIPGLNTLGLTLIRNDYLPGAAIPPHVHSRATELALVLKGTITLGFVSADPATGYKNNTAYLKECAEGDVFVVPQGLVHFGQVSSDGDATTITAFNSQNPGFNFVPAQVFGRSLSLPQGFLAKSFQVTDQIIEEIQNHFQ